MGRSHRKEHHHADYAIAMSPNEEKAALKDFATRWRQLGPELESMKSKSLRERTEDEHRRAIIDVLSGLLAWFLKGSTAFRVGQAAGDFCQDGANASLTPQSASNCSPRHILHSSF